MDATTRQAAVDDLLEYRRDGQRELGLGRHLALALLGRAWNGSDDDYRLARVLEAVIADDVAQRSVTLKLPTLPPIRNGSLAWLLDKHVKRHKVLEGLAFVWAHYVEQIPTAVLAEQINCHIRTVQNKLEIGRAEVVRLVAAREQMAASQVHVPHDPLSGNGRVPSDVVGHDAMPSAQNPASVHTGAAPIHSTSSNVVHAPNYTVSGDHAQTVIGPVHAPVHQSQTHHHHYGTSTETHPRNDYDVFVFRLGLLLMLLAFWLLQIAPVLCLGALVGVCMWRSGRQVWRIAQEQVNVDTEDRVWYIGYTLAWIGALLWSAVLLQRAVTLASNEVFMVERLTLVVAFVGVSAFTFWLCAVDLLLWAQRTPSSQWPKRAVYERSLFVWQRRWPLLGLTWLMLAIFSFSLVMFVLTASR